MGPTLLLQVTEQGQRVDTAVEWWLGRNVLCLILGPDRLGMSGQTPVWVGRPCLHMNGWLPGVHCDAKVCPIVTFTPESTVSKKDCV